jgi:hypothetical protein
LKSLLRCERRPEQVLAKLEDLEVEGPVEAPAEEEEDEGLDVEFTADDAIHVLTRFVEGDLDLDDLEEWAEVVKNHHEITFETLSEDVLLALLKGVQDLDEDSAASWIARLEGDEE